MAIRTWSSSLLVALGVSLLAGVGQPGIAHALGVLRLTRSFTDTPDQWPAQLVWVGWFAASAVTAGAVLGERYARRHALAVTTVVQGSFVVAATLGATVVAPLCMLAARNAQVPAVEPALAVAAAALYGTLAGSVTALAALRYAPVRWNVAGASALVWLVTLGTAVPSLVAAQPLPAVRLGVFEPPWLGPDVTAVLAALLLPGQALLVGAAVAVLARRHGQPLLTAAASGVAAPLLIATAYLLAGSGQGDDGHQSTPYRAALVAVLTGALGAATVALLSRPVLDALLSRPALDVLRARPAANALRVRAAFGVTAIGAAAIGTAAIGALRHRMAELSRWSPAVRPCPRPDIVEPPHPVAPAAPPVPAWGGRLVPLLPAGTGGREEPCAPTVGVLDWSRPIAAISGTAAASCPAPRAEPTGPGGKDFPGEESAPGDAPPTAAGVPAQADAAGVDDAPGGLLSSRAGSRSGGSGADGKRLRGLLRRDRFRLGGLPAVGRNREEAPLPPQDAEYVDWVAQLSRPVPEATAPPPVERRTLRVAAQVQQDCPAER